MRTRTLKIEFSQSVKDTGRADGNHQLPAEPHTVKIENERHKEGKEIGAAGKMCCDGKPIKNASKKPVRMRNCFEQTVAENIIVLKRRLHQNPSTLL